MSCKASATCQGRKVQGLCEKCYCSICGAEPPPLTIFLWKNGSAIRLCDKHLPLLNLDKLDKTEFEQIIFITP